MHRIDYDRSGRIFLVQGDTVPLSLLWPVVLARANKVFRGWNHDDGVTDEMRHRRANVIFHLLRYSQGDICFRGQRFLNENEAEKEANNVTPNSCFLALRGILGFKFQFNVEIHQLEASNRLMKKQRPLLHAPDLFIKPNQVLIQTRLLSILISRRFLSLRKLQSFLREHEL